MVKYIPANVESKWQKKWKEDKLFSPKMGEAKNPYYALMMFPYPSAEGLHVGNMYPFTGTDIFARYKRMKGYDVLEPIGLDGFGIHSENYAMKINKHPMELAQVTEKHFYEQLLAIGDGFDWTRTVETYKADYYKWTQWLFLKMYEKGVAYRKKAEVNWCPSCQTVLADEQVINGLCERCNSKVEQKELEQWFFKITDYAERLLKNLDWIDWSDKIKIAQKNWIGKSEGIVINFDGIEIFGTRQDTIFGVTFIVISPENPVLNKLVEPKQQLAVEEYVRQAKKKSELERRENKAKTGVFTGSYVKNPINGEKVPVWVADYVLSGYGTGAVMGVPAHDQRDFEFAKQFNLPIKEVVKGGDISKAAYEGEGEMVNSGKYDGMPNREAREKISDYLEEENLGKRQAQYHLRDWLISRQRYWGPPIPMIYCEKDGIVPVPEKDLPVELPFVENFRPAGTGKAPLASVPEFINTTCPKCGGPARRETDVSDTFLDSSWYFLRYPSTDFDSAPFDDKRTKNWLPVDMYIGGAEHSVLHLLYSRFVTMVLYDLGLISFEEPFEKFRAHGLIISEGAKMSKSKGNVINPDKYIKEYGADTLRMYLMFMGPFSQGGDFRDVAIGGLHRFLTRVWDIMQKAKNGEASEEEKRVLAKTVQKVGEDIEQLHFNTAISTLMEAINFFSKNGLSLGSARTFLLLLAPFAPHITEELWQIVHGSKTNSVPTNDERTNELTNWSIHKQSWPKFDNKYLVVEKLPIVIQINGKLRDTIVIDKDIVNNREVIEKLAREAKNAKKYLEEKVVKKVVHIEGKLVNFVTA